MSGHQNRSCPLMAIRPLPVIRQRDVRERRRGTSGTSHHEQNAGWGSFCVTRCALQGTQHHAKPTRTDERISAPRIGPVPVTGTLVPCLSDVASFEHDESDDDHADCVAIEPDEPAAGRPGSRSAGRPQVQRHPRRAALAPPCRCRRVSLGSHCVFGRRHGHHPDHYPTTPARQQHATDAQSIPASSSRTIRRQPATPQRHNDDNEAVRRHGTRRIPRPPPAARATPPSSPHNSLTGGHAIRTGTIGARVQTVTYCIGCKIAWWLGGR